MPYATRHRSNTSPATSSQPTSSAPAPPLPIKLKNSLPRRKAFPAPGLQLHPDDRSSRVFFAIGRALDSVNNCAMTVKDLAEACLKHGLSCSGSSPINAASQQITSFIRAHQRRCLDMDCQPLIKSFVLTGTSDDDQLTPALYSRAGGTAQRGSGAVDTAFRKGTQVWYMDAETGLVDPFEKLGIRVPGCKKRRRMSRKEDTCPDSEEEKRPRIKLKIRLAPLANSTNSITKPQEQPRNPPRQLTPIDDMASPDSPPSSPISECSLPLPPYPIESHCHYLRDIPLSPYDVPEYASPPPDSEDDDHDFHTSMMAGADDSENEYMPPLKYEIDSDMEDDDGHRSRSRSTSWTTVTDPRTPKEEECDLSQSPTIKIEGREEDMWTSNTMVKDMLDHWDSSVNPSLSEEQIKEEDSNTNWLRHWMSTEDVDDLVQLATVQSTAAEVKQEEIDEEGGLSSHHRRNVGRSLSTPILDRRPSAASFSSVPPSPLLVAMEEDDDVEILGPDSVSVNELDSAPWQGPRPPLGKRLSRARVPLRTTSSEGNVGQSLLQNRFVTIEGVYIHELALPGHILRRRISDSLIHLPSLLTTISKRPLSSKFMQLDGAMHVRSGRLEGTWVPLQFARNLIKEIPVSKDIISFLNDGLSGQSISPIKLEHLPVVSSSSMDVTGLLMNNSSGPLLPPISLQPSSPTSESSQTSEQSRIISTSSAHAVSYRSAWQRDGFTDWKVNSNIELISVHSPFSSLVPLRAVASTPQQPQQGVVGTLDCPLSPQEEEILFALVEMNDTKQQARFSPAPTVDIQQDCHQTSDEDADDEECDNEEEEEEEEEEADDDSKSQPRRSKRVASRVPNVRTTEPAVTRRSARTRK